MKLHHVALIRTSEAASDRFFESVLGLAKTRSKTADEDGNLFEIKERA